MGWIRKFVALSIAGLIGTTAQAQSTQSISPSSDKPYLTIDQLRAKYRDPAGKIAVINGTEIYYKDEGRGPVLLMIHGSESSLRTWDRITEKLKSRYRIIRFDIPGYGLSRGVTDEVAASTLPTEIPAQLLSRLGVKEYNCVGVSSGGTMCMYLAARYPAMVKRIILSNTPSDPVKTDHLVMPQSFLDAQAKAKETGFRDLTFWNEFLSYFSGVPNRISPKTRSEYYDFYRRIPEKHPIAMVARIGDGKEAKILMSEIKAPALLIWGARDHLLPAFAADILAKYLPQSQISKLIFPDVGHYPPLEVPDRFADLIQSYIEVVTPAN